MKTTRKTLLRSSALTAAAFAAGAVLVFGAPESLRAATPLSPPPDAAVQVMPNFADVAEAVAPAVVNIQVTERASPEAMARMNPDMPDLPEGLRRFFGDDFAERFGQQQGPQDRPLVQGLGSGFLISADGYIVTNDHVAGEADRIAVTLQDGREFKGERIGRDPKTDLVLLKIDGRDLPYVSFAEQTPRVGEWVIAVGSPFGLGNTVTAGIVSAHGRSLGPDGPYDGFMQIDAAINRGNSGGPAFNLKGEVVGVNTAIFSPTGGNVGIGFAVPAETAKSVVAQLRDKGVVERGWLGVSIQAVTPDIAESLGFDKRRGALVSNVTPDSPADRAGLQIGDVVVAVDQTTIGELRDLPKAIGTMAPGSAVRLKVVRGGGERTLSVKIGLSPDSVDQLAMGAGSDADIHLGMSLASLDPAKRQAYGLDERTTGVLVVDVATDAAAFEKGVRPGDVIVGVGNDKVTKPQDVFNGITAAKDNGRKAVLLLISRNGHAQYVAIPLGVA